jgi:dTDP-4-dehydrorhamnose 3,5-epimerase
LKVTKTEIAGVLILEPKVHQDERGFLLESFNQEIATAIGVSEPFSQDNHSHSKKNVLRGLHYQLPPQSQGKLVRAAAGEIFDVAVDLRRGSLTLGRWVSARLSAENKKMIWIPAGFAHGFLVLSDSADCLYKATSLYAPLQERTIVWNDPALKIDWPLQSAPLVSEKDARGTSWSHAELFD